MEQLCRRRYHILSTVFDLLCSCANIRIFALLVRACGLTTYNFFLYLRNLCADVLLVFTDFLVMVCLDWCASHADSGLARLTLLPKLRVLIRVKVASSHFTSPVSIFAHQSK